MSLLTAQFLRSKVTSETKTNMFAEIPFFSASMPGWLFNNLHAHPEKSSVNAPAPLISPDLILSFFLLLNSRGFYHGGGLMCDYMSRVVFQYLADFASVSSCRCTHRTDCCCGDESVHSNFTALWKMTLKLRPPVSSCKVFIHCATCVPGQLFCPSWQISVFYSLSMRWHGSHDTWITSKPTTTSCVQIIDSTTRTVYICPYHRVFFARNLHFSSLNI